MSLRIEQETELHGTFLRGARDSTVTIKTSMQIFAHAVIERADSLAATVMALADSLRVNGLDEESRELEDVRRTLVGKKVYMKVFPDGSSQLISADSRVDATLRSLLADMPATLPRGSVQVGSSWSRSVTIPLEHGAGRQTVRTTFKLDSLSPDKRLAYISMKGVIGESAPAAPSQRQPETTGDLRGSLTLDRKRGWIIDSVAAININTFIRNPLENTFPAVRVQIRMIQRMRTVGAP